MPQNIYDDPQFFDGYRALREQDTGLNGAIEIPAMRALLPSLTGLGVADLGCGFGDFARFARIAGARDVLGVDVSARMLEVAKTLTVDASIRYVRITIEEWSAPPASVDLIVSSLALHYIADFGSVVRRVTDALVPGGALVFSVEHPMCTAHPIGWQSAGGRARAYWPVDNYAHEGARHTDWFVTGVVKYHRTVATYLNTLMHAGLSLVHIEEPEPIAGALAQRPTLAEESRRPAFLLVSAVKPKQAIPT